jgi:hypothetical protein
VVDVCPDFQQILQYVPPSLLFDGHRLRVCTRRNTGET